MNDFPFSKSQALRAIEAVNCLLKGNIREHVLTDEMILQLTEIKAHLQAAHDL